MSETPISCGPWSPSWFRMALTARYSGDFAAFRHALVALAGQSETPVLDSIEKWCEDGSRGPRAELVPTVAEALGVELDAITECPLRRMY